MTLKMLVFQSSLMLSLNVCVCGYTGGESDPHIFALINIHMHTIGHIHTLVHVFQ